MYNARLSESQNEWFRRRSLATTQLTGSAWTLSAQLDSKCAKQLRDVMIFGKIAFYFFSVICASWQGFILCPRLRQNRLSLAQQPSPPRCGIEGTGGLT